MRRNIQLKVNGSIQSITCLESQTLLEVLRDNLGLTGTKKGCDEGDCGACTVLINGKPFNSCLTLAVNAQGTEMTTIEGIQLEGELHPIQKAFVDQGAVQCGFCTPGMILATKALLDANPNPSESEIRQALSGNLCRCTGYVRIMEAVKAASNVLSRMDRE